MFAQDEPLSPKRGALCSRENAERIASRVFDQGFCPVSVIRTGDALQPFRVSTAPSRGDDVALQMVS